MAIRKGGQISKSDVTDTELRELFRAADVDGDGVLSINELTAFVGGALPVTDTDTAETAEVAEAANTDADSGASSVAEAREHSNASTSTGTSSSFSLPVYHMNTVVQELKLRQEHTEVTEAAAKEGGGRAHEEKQEGGQRSEGVSDGGQLAHLSAEQALDALQ